MESEDAKNGDVSIFLEDIGRPAIMCVKEK